jgi:quercetin dioxygenase-like cupin family protein
MKTQSENFLYDSKIDFEDVGGGLSRQMMGYNTELMMVKVKFETGGIGSIHQHTHSQCTFIDSGLFEITINGEKKILKAGDGFFVEPNAPHGAVCLEAGLLIDTFSPMRKDFL